MCVCGNGGGRGGGIEIRRRFHVSGCWHVFYIPDTLRSCDLDNDKTHTIFHKHKPIEGAYLKFADFATTPLSMRPRQRRDTVPLLATTDD